MPKAILFDWDGTLANTRSAVVDAMEYVLQKYGKESWDITKAKYRDTTKSLKENFTNFFQDDAQKAYADYVKYYSEYGLGKVVPLRNAEDFLRLCNQSGMDVYVISNKEKSLLLKEIAFCFPEIKFAKISGDGDAIRNKPAPDPVFEALKDVDYPIDRENVWLIGDSKQDTECAYNSGVLPVLLGEGKFMESEYIQNKMKSTQPLMIFDNYEEIIEFVKKMN